MISLFDNNAGAASVGPASPSSPLAPSVSGSSPHEGVFESSAKISLGGKLGYTSGNSVIVEISNLNKVKESYTEEPLLEEKFVHTGKFREDDGDLRKRPLEAMYPRDPSAPLQKWAHTQLAVGARVACYHDAIKLSLPAMWTPTHHLLFTFYHVICKPNQNI